MQIQFIELESNIRIVHHPAQGRKNHGYNKRKLPKRGLAMKKIAVAIIALTVSCTAGFSQNYRPSNPDQPNGYHASEASSHYHGNAHLPAQPQNGYHASEARSHSGGSKYESSGGWGGSSSGGRWGSSDSGGRWGSSDSGGRWGSSDAGGRWGGSGGRWGGNQEQSSEWGSRWNNQDQSSGIGSRWSNQNQNSNWGQTTPAEQTFARGMLRRMADRNIQENQNAPATVVGQPDPGVRYSATGTGGILDSRMTNAESSVQRMIRNGGGFDRIYASENQ